MELEIDTPRWSVPLLQPSRYKGIKGGRGSGKSHWTAERLVELMVENDWLKVVCIREIQRSLKYSAKALVEGKIRKLGVQHLFDITQYEIRRRGGAGLFIFEGMQDHTADSIKSLEGFHIAWVEEAQRLSHRSLKLLRPTIRESGSELWFTWNPDQDDDAVDDFLCGAHPPESLILVHVNYDENPFLPDELYEEMLHDRKFNQDSFHHVWEGGYNKKSAAQIFAGKWRIDEFEAGSDWDGPYHGLDFGFSQDPTAATRLYVHDKRLWVRNEAVKVGLELDDTATYVSKGVPGISRHVIRADSARPESISYLKRHGLPRIIAAEKGKGSVEDGIAFIKSFHEIVIHEECKEFQREARLYSYKVDKGSGEVQPVIVDAFNHLWDAARYALSPMIKNNDRAKRFRAMAK